MSCTCETNDSIIHFKLHRFCTSQTLHPWPFLVISYLPPGSDFVTDIPYHRWDHELYYDSDPNCWMQAPVAHQVHAAMVRGRLLWKLEIAIFSFQIWFRYDVCVDEHDDALQHGFTRCGSDSASQSHTFSRGILKFGSQSSQLTRHSNFISCSRYGQLGLISEFPQIDCGAMFPCSSTLRGPESYQGQASSTVSSSKALGQRFKSWVH